MQNTTSKQDLPKEDLNYIQPFQSALMEGSRPRVGVGTFLIQDGQLLVGKRRRAHGEGEWACPGGHLEYGEGILACAARELKEETGLTANSYRYATIVNNLLGTDNLHYITICVVATGVSSQKVQLLEPEKCEGWEWCPLDDLPTPQFPPLPAFVDALGGPKALEEWTSQIHLRN